MTKISHLAFNRKFELTEKYGKLERRDKVTPPFMQKVGMCPECDKPVFSSAGQFLRKDERGLYFHKACRKKKGRFY